jgi:DNA (cytosine-5)-methyltransferase 1
VAKVVSLFAGIGGICLAFKNAGANIVWANEIDKYACRTYRENFGDEYLVEGDIKHIPAHAIPDFDILVAGFPCQSFSIAGHQRGFEDDRGNLFFEIMRIVRAKHPKVVFLENVKNLKSHDEGRTLRVICSELRSVGYTVSYKILNATEYENLPQNRERIYIVASNSQFEFPSPIPLTKSIHDIIDVNDRKPAKYYYNESKYYPILREAITMDTVYQLRRVYVRGNKNNVCPTLTANMGEGGHNVPLIMDNYGIRKLTPLECLCFQGFPHSFKIPVSDSQAYKQAGNSVAIPVVERIAQNILKGG